MANVRIWLALTAAVLLTACDGVVTYGPTQSKSDVPESMFSIAIEKGAIVTDVRGNPFAIPDERFASLVRDHMYGANFGPEVRFVAKPGPDTIEPYRVSVFFTRRSAIVRPDYLCEAKAASGADDANSGRLTVAMSFCFGSEAISGTWGTVTGVTGPDDPKFRALIRQTALTLVPIHRREPDQSD